MKHIKFSHKVMAMTLLLAFSPSLIPINHVFASNNGPTAPEAASFEPVDATDMVNLSSGDLSYVLPLLNVPSPEGGYPLALSYHAGIAMDQEASWVGLGWSLNPGSINRSVSGLPDDWKEGTKADVIYGIGGESKSSSFSASVGWGDQGSIGLYFSNSSNKAFGGEGSYSYSSDFGISGNLAGLGGRVGTDGVGINFDVVRAVATQAINADTGEGSEVYLRGNNRNLFSVSADANFKTGSVSGSISKYGIGMTLGTNYGSVSIGQGSISLYGANSLSTDLNTLTTGLMIIVPFYNIGSVSYSQRKTRYWLYDRLGYDGIGSLYADNLTNRHNNDALDFTNHFDSYESTYEHNRVNQYKTSNYSSVSYDSYVVSGQGITGKMTPRIFELGSLKPKYQKIQLKSIDDKFTGVEYKLPVSNFQKGISQTNNGIHYYFENFNASYLRLKTDPWTVLSSLGTSSGENQPDHSLITTSPNGMSNYNAITKQAYKGNFVETFTNKDLNSSLPNGFIDTNSKGFNRTDFVGTKINDGIGAFKITTIDGKTYHYSLPVYQKEKFNRSSELNKNINQDFYEEQSLDAYATHWLLTAVTGPDYVDANNDHKVDDSDYGYWVNFEYGKWSEGYSWRNPSGLMDFEESEKSKSYQWGIKEVYYLNKVNTRTHTAFFVKEERLDNKSTPISVGQSRTNMRRYTSTAYGSNEQNIVFGKDGLYYLKGTYQNVPFGDPVSVVKARAVSNDDYYIKTRIHKSLKLKKILLYKNSDIPTDIETPNPDETSGTLKSEIYIKQDIEGDYQDQSGTFSLPTSIVKDVQYFGEYYNNVLDVNDIDLTTIENQASKVIDFGFNYSLFRQVSNSDAGRLTLTAIANKGKNGTILVPPYKFRYNQAIYNRDVDDWGYHQVTASGSLTKIKTPLGADINILYEEDDYHNEIIPTKRVFDNKLQFDFSVVNNKLRILVEDEQTSGGNITFSDFFELGKADLDFWACYREDYFAFGCKTRAATVDIPQQEVDVVAVDQNSVLLETELGNTLDEGGLNDFFHLSPFGLEHHPGMIRVEKFRGECENPEGCINVTPRLVLDYFLYGNKDLKDVNGGGLRVKEINTRNLDGEVYSSKYFYNHKDFDKNKFDSNYRSSGVTSYSPSRYTKEVKYINELPSPYVVYEYVTIEREGNGKFIGKTRYKFKVLKDILETSNEFSIGDVLKIKKNQEDQSSLTSTISGETINAKFDKFVLEDNLASIGSLLKTTVFNEFGQQLKITENSYKANTEKNQGILEESFINSKFFIDKLTETTGGGGTYEQTVNYSSSSKITYPNVLESIKVTESGITSTTYNNIFDFNTGQVLETHTLDSRGNAFKTEIVPAYTIEEYSDNANGYSMASKVDNPTNKNMLSQEAMTKTYIKVGNDWKETNVGITTWNNEWTYSDYEGTGNTPTADSEKIWRKHKTYLWDGIRDTDGTFQGFTSENHDGFNWNVGPNVEQTNPEWKNTSTVTRYNHYSMSLETADINSTKSSTKMGDGDSKILVTGNAGYNELFYSGAEDLDMDTSFYGGEVGKGTASEVPDYAHTGEKSLQIKSGQEGYNVQVTEGKSDQYKVSLWAKYGTHTNVILSVEGQSEITHSPNERVRAGDWVQLNFYFTLKGTKTVSVGSSSGSVIVDDFRLHPINARVTSYVYNEWDELTHIIGSNNMAVKYRYDEMGRLEQTLTEVADFNGPRSGGFKPTTEHEYTYKY